MVSKDFDQLIPLSMQIYVYEKFVQTSNNKVM